MILCYMWSNGTWWVHRRMQYVHGKFEVGDHMRLTTICSQKPTITILLLGRLKTLRPQTPESAFGLCLAKALTSRTRRHFSKCLWNCKVKKRLMHTHLRMRVFEWRAQQQVLICRPSCSRPIWWIRTGRRMLIRDSEGWTCLRRKGSILQIHVAESELDE